MTTNKRYADAGEMARDIIGDEDPQFADDLQDQIERRALVRLLATLRNETGVTQEDVAKILDCRQGRISKIENGVDETVSIGEIEAYAKATGYDVELVFRDRDATLVDRIRQYAIGIRRCFDRLRGFAKKDATVSQEVAKFHTEALCHLVSVVANSAKNPPVHQSGRRLHVRIADDETDSGAESSSGSCEKTPHSLEPADAC